MERFIFIRIARQKNSIANRTRAYRRREYSGTHDVLREHASSSKEF